MPSLGTIARLGAVVTCATLLLPLAMSLGEPERLNVAVLGLTYQSAGSPPYWELLSCIRWTNASTGTGYALIIDGTTVALAPDPTPFRPGWLQPNPDCLTLVMPTPNETIRISAAATNAGNVVAISCNVSIQPLLSLSADGSAYACGTPDYAPAFRLQGYGEVTGDNLTFHVNHTIHSRNATVYQYAYRTSTSDSWTLAQPSSSVTIGGANFTAPANASGYRLANFTITNASVQQSDRFIWRVRAYDTFTFEVSDWSCELSLAGNVGLVSSCQALLRSGAGGLGNDPRFPLMDLPTAAALMGLSEVTVGLLALLLFGFFVASAYASVMGALGIIFAIGIMLAFGYLLDIIPGWLIVIIVLICSLVTWGAFFREGGQ